MRAARSTDLSETSQADGRNFHGALQSFGQDRRPGARNAIGTTTLLSRQRDDEALFFESYENAVEGSRTKHRAGHFFNVLDDCVPVLRTASQARENENRRVLRPT